jgi:hypothetical protein
LVVVKSPLYTTFSWALSGALCFVFGLCLGLLFGCGGCDKLVC